MFGVAQLYNVPMGIIPLEPLVGVIENGVPVQIVEVISEIIATGLTLTVTVNRVPEHEPDTGVI